MDDTTRGVGRPGPGDEFSGRADETTRNYAGEPSRSAPRIPAGSGSVSAPWAQKPYNSHDNVRSARRFRS